MGYITKLFHNHITLLKAVCLAALFSPLWGLWWYDLEVGVGHNPLLLVWINYLLKSIPVAIAYSSVFLLGVVGFVIVAFIRPPAVRVPLMVTMLIGWAFELSVLDLNGGLSSQNLFWLMWKERAAALEAISGYAPYIVRNCVFVALLGIVLCAPPAPRFSVSGAFGLLPIVSGALVTGMIIYTKGGTQTFPIPFGTFSNATIVLAKATSSPSSLPRFWDRAQLSEVVANADPKIEGKVNPIFNKIVMIMDESVRGDYLSLNDTIQNTTPFLNATENLVNFGVAISGGNCSHISRTIIRFGMRQTDLPNGWRAGLKRPTIWQFAHSAGYKTVYMDAWGYAPGRGVLSPAEERLIDSRITIFEEPDYLRDQKLAGELLRALQQEEPALIYVEKYGVHFPYANKYPSNFRQSPLEPKSATSNDKDEIVVWSVAIDGFLRSFLPPFDDEIAHYPNAVAWSVDEFFRALLPGVDLSRTLIIYTSDHGQSLLAGRFSHCSSRTPVPLGEVYVPLFAVTSVSEFEDRLKSGAAGGLGRFSHFEVFPTVLLAMGYDPSWVGRTYGASLMDAPSLDRAFMIGSPEFQPMMVPADHNSRPTSSATEPGQAQMPRAELN